MLNTTLDFLPIYKTALPSPSVYSLDISW